MTRLQAYNILSGAMPRFRGVLGMSGVKGMTEALDLAIATLRLCAEAETVQPSADDRSHALARLRSALSDSHLR